MTTNNKTNNANLTGTNNVTFQIGDKVYHTAFPNFSRIGEIIEKDAKDNQVRFFMVEKNKYSLCKLSDLWLPLPSMTDAVIENTKQPNLLDNVIGETANKSKVKADKTMETAKDDADKMTQDEIKERDSLKRKYLDLQNKLEKLPFQQAEIVNTLVTKRLYREKHANFELYAKQELGLTREYASNLAQIGGFYAISKEFIDVKGIETSINSMNRFVRNANDTKALLNLPNATLEEFKPLVDSTIQITQDVAKKNTAEGKTVKVTPKIVDATNKAITDELEDLPINKGNLIQLAIARLGEKRENIIEKAQKLVNEKAEAKVSSCINHDETVIKIENNLLYLGCGCKWRLVID